MRECGLSGVQLALDPIRTGAWDLGETAGTLRTVGIKIISGMMAMRGEDYSTLDSIRETGGVRSDAHWAANREAAAGNAEVARRLGLSLVTFHAGFLPHDSADPLRRVMLDRIAEIAGAFDAAGIGVALETGQEDAETLAGVLADLGARGTRVGVNFDPANMILYGMGDPVAALSRLAPHVRQIHIKDAVPTRAPGTWGEERVVGEGGVDWPAFFRTLRERAINVPLVIEREGGDQRVRDVRTAAAVVQRFQSAH